ncbi:MAG: hypothetical protein HFG41_08310 [Coprococcus sp.]|nr:hypothetical protein [Coprococcus sp.]
MKKNKFPLTNIGTVSLLMIFIVLCMVTFAALSLSSAASDARSGQRIAEHSQDYYAASNEAEEVLASLDDVFAKAYAQARTTEDYYQLILEALPSEVQPEQEGEAGSSDKTFSDGRTLIVSYQIEINDSQALKVRVGVFPLEELAKEDSASFYKILAWQKVITKTWEGDNSIQLIQ